MDFYCFLEISSSMKPQFSDDCISVKKKLRGRKSEMKKNLSVSYCFLDSPFYNFKGFWYFEVDSL